MWSDEVGLSKSLCFIVKVNIKLVYVTKIIQRKSIHLLELKIVSCWLELWLQYLQICQIITNIDIQSNQYYIFIVEETVLQELFLLQLYNKSMYIKLYNCLYTYILLILLFFKQILLEILASQLECAKQVAFFCRRIC